MEKNNKKKNIIVGSIVGVLLLIVGVSYGFFVSLGKQDKFITFKAGACLSITITEESDAISLANIYPVTIEEGLTYTPYTFTIKNNCDNIAPYQISLESLDFKDNTLSGDYLRVSLEDSEGRINTNILSSLNEAEKTIENSYDSRLLYSGVLNNQGSTGFKLRMWLDYDATKEQAASKVYKSKIAVSARSDEQLTDEIFTINYTEKSKEEGANGYYNSYSTTVNITDKKDNNISAKYCVGSERCIPDTNVELTNNSFDYTYNNGSNILCTQAKDSIGNQSIIVCNEEIKIDTEAPSITYELADNTPGENSYYKELQIRLAGSDTGSGVSKIKYCVTESTCEPTSETTNNQVITLDSSSNPQKICSKVIDNNNNESSVICSETYKVDTNNPNIEVSLASSTTAANGWYKAVSIKGEASDSESGIGSIKYCTTTNETCEPDSSTTASSIDVPISNNASAQKVCFKAIDNSGRESEVKCSGEYKVDNSTSTVSFGVASQTAGENGWYKALNIKVSATNNYSGITGVKYCTTTGSTCTPSSTVSNNGSVALGTNASAQRVCANATDGKGETTSTSCSGTYKVDKTAPTISTFYIGGSGNPASVSSTSTTLYLKWTANDVGSYCIMTSNTSNGCSWKAVTNGATTVSPSYTLSSGDGTKTLYAFIKDKAGNISAVKSDSITLSIPKMGNYLLNTLKPSGLSTTMEGDLYRFKGNYTDAVNNYICFGTNNKSTCTSDTDKYMYRIIGINASNQLKLIKKEALNSTYQWYTSYVNTYDIYLHDSKLYSNISGSAFYNNTTYVPTSWKSKIANYTWKSFDGLGTYHTPSEAFTIEQNSFYYQTYTGYVSLLYLSDYLYSIPVNNAVCSYYQAYCLDTWINLRNNDNVNGNEWYNFFTIYSGGEEDDDEANAGIIYGKDSTPFRVLSSDFVTSENYVRPVFFLNSSVTFVSGTGTATDPFIIN